MYKEVRGWQKHLDFILIDFLGLHFSFIIAYWFRWGVTNPYRLTTYRDLAIFASLFYLMIVLVDNSYSGVLRRSFAREIYSVLRLNLLLLGSLLIYLFAVHTTVAYSRIQMSTFILVNTFVMLLLHSLRKRRMHRKAEASQEFQHLLLITADKAVHKRIHLLMQNSYTNLKLDGVVILGGGDTVLPVPILGETEEEALEYVRTHVVDEVLLDLTGGDSGALIEQLLNMGVTVHLSLDHLAGKCPNPIVEKVNGIQCLTSAVHTISPAESFVKRMIDILSGLVGCVLTGILFVFVAPVIKLQAPGPVFFHQERVGKNGRPFQLHKFRSMYAGAEQLQHQVENKMTGLMFKADNDPRVYPFGRFLRRTSLDEFPQFWNILKGDMSLVGTRPPTKEEYQQYDFHHKGRLAARPGLTGLWQVSGRSDITDFEEVVRLDNEYIQNWSLMLDTEILFKTIGVVLKGKGSL